MAEVQGSIKIYAQECKNFDFFRVKMNVIWLDFDAIGKEEVMTAAMIVHDFWIAPKAILFSSLCDPEKNLILEKPTVEMTPGRKLFS